VGGRDRSAEHEWNAATAGSVALHGPGRLGAVPPLTDKQKADGARTLSCFADRAGEGPDALREVLDAAGIDLAELREIRSRPAPTGTP
jgi:hypothetical protein